MFCSLVFGVSFLFRACIEMLFSIPSDLTLQVNYLCPACGNTEKSNCIWQYRSVCLCLVWLMFRNDLSNAKWLLSMSCLIGRELSETFLPTSWKGEISDYANFAFALESQKLISLFFLHPRHVTGNFRPQISCFFSTRPLSVILSLYLYLHLYLSLYLLMCESTATVVKSPEQIIGAQSRQIL